MKLDAFFPTPSWSQGMKTLWVQTCFVMGFGYSLPMKAGGGLKDVFFFMFGFCPGGALNPSIASTLCIGAFVAPVARLQVFGGGDL